MQTHLFLLPFPIDPPFTRSYKIYVLYLIVIVHVSRVSYNLFKNLEYLYLLAVPLTILKF